LSVESALRIVAGQRSSRTRVSTQPRESAGSQEPSDLPKLDQYQRLLEDYEEMLAKQSLRIQQL
jgi:hypothetical protein